MNQKERQKLKKKCDALWSKVTKMAWKNHNGDMCAWCKTRPFAHSDHIANRWKHATRWMVENCVCLCAGCHLFRKKREPAEWCSMVIETIGIDTYNSIMDASKDIVKDQDYEEVYRYLKLSEKVLSGAVDEDGDMMNNGD